MHHAQELAESQGDDLAAALLEGGDIIGKLGDGLQNRLFFGMRIGTFAPLAARRAMFGEADALLLRFNDAGVGGEVAGIELNLYLVIGFAHLDPAANPGDRDRVAIGVQGDVAFDIDGALMEPVDFGNPDWQRLQPRLLDGEQVARRRVQVFLMASVDPVAPLARLLVEILPRREPSSSKEVGLDEPEWPFDASGTVRIAAFVSGKIEAETFGESRHLGHRNHLGPRAAQDYDVSVVDHHSFCETAEVASGVGQKDLAIEPLERRVALKE